VGRTALRRGESGGLSSGRMREENRKEEIVGCLVCGGDCKGAAMPGEYHLWPWRKQPPRQGADAETQTGDGRLSPLQFLPLSSRSKFNSWDSRSKPAPLRLSYETGASTTEIGAISRSGCSVRGASRWSQPSAAKRRRAESNNWGPDFRSGLVAGRGRVMDQILLAATMACMSARLAQLGYPAGR